MAADRADIEHIMMGPPRQVETEDSEVATQQPLSTQEIGPATQRLASSELTPAEELDIICSLRPTNAAAFEIVGNIADDSPEHVRRNQGFSRKQRLVVETYDKVETAPKNNPQDDLSQATPEIQGTQEPAAPGEIALRMSSKVRDMDLGFVFGRDERKSDIALKLSGHVTARVSGMHFRIFLNDNGMIMIEDMSTNGTLVDNNWLRYKRPVPGNPIRRILTSGSMIEFFVDDSKRTARFLVAIPERRDEFGWQRRLHAYIAELRRVRSRKTAALIDLTVKKDSPVAQVPTPGVTQDEIDPAEQQDMALFTAGTMPFNHGMRWSGGKDYKVVGKVGAGAFATVYKLVEVHTGNEVAAKEIEKRRFMKNGVLDLKITTELDILKRSKHPHVISSFDHVDTPRDLYILMEFVPYGDLSQHVNTGTKLSDQDHRLITKQLCHALAYLHDNGIAHRDIKPENIVKKAASPVWVKLADFGLSKVISQGENAVYQTFCGTLLYCAPEVYPGFAQKRRGEKVDSRKARSDPYSVAVDIWSLAAVMFHLVCGNPPYEASAANHGVHMLDTILKEQFPHDKYSEAKCAPDWELFFTNSLQTSAVARWSARRLLKLPFMQQIPDVVPIDYQFRSADNAFAYEEESSDDEMTEDDPSVIEEGVSFELADNDLGASQLSINDADSSDIDDRSMTGTEETTSAHNGLGIRGVGISVEEAQESRVEDKEGSRYNLRSRNGVPRQPPPQTPRGRRNGAAKSANPQQLTPATMQKAGMLFGEVGDSGVFGSAVPTPRIVNGPGIPVPSEPQHPSLQDISSQADNIAAGNVSPESRRIYYRAADSAASLRGAEGQINQLRMASPDTDFSNTTSLNNSPSGSTRSKHHLNEGDEEAPEGASVKRSRLMSSARRTSRSSLVHELQNAADVGEQPTPPRRAVTPPSSSARQGLDNQDTPRARKPGVKSLVFSAEFTSPPRKDATDGRPRLPDTAIAQTFPNLDDTTPTSSNEQQRKLSSSADAQAMPPPRSHGSHSSSRPPTPVQPAGDQPVVSAIGVLSPGRKSIKVDPVYITLQKTEWGRAPECTHVYKNPMDTRISKSAFTIMLWDPKTGRKTANNPNTDWTKARFYAVISTRCSGHILINGVPMTRKRGNNDKVQLGLLHTGDIIELFDDQKGEHLRFHVRFWFGAAKEERNGDGDDFRVFVGEDAMQRAVAEAEAKRSDVTVKA